MQSVKIVNMKNAWDEIDEFRGTLVNGEWPTVPELFLMSESRYSNNVAFSVFEPDRKTITYKEAKGYIFNIASYLIDKGIKKGDKVALNGKNSPEWALSYFGILMAGAVVVPIDNQMHVERFMRLSEYADSKFVIADFDVLEKMKSRANDWYNGLLGFGMLKGNSPEYVKVIDMKSESPISDRVLVSDEDIAAILFTSGTTGNENFSTNLSSAVYNYYTDRYYQNFAGAYLDNMENPNLAWEQKMDYNVGLDANIGRLLLKFDAYISDTKDMAFNRSIVASTGFTTVRDNLGQVRNKGLELSATYSVIQREDAFLNVYFKAAANDNRIRKISDALRSYNESIMEAAEEQGTTAPVAIYQDDTPVNAIWAVRSLGIDPLTGQEVFLDLDGNKTYTWSAANLVNCGSSDPKYNGNFGFNGEYKGIGLSAVFTFYAGGKMYNNTLVNRVENCYIGNNVDRRVFSDRWYEAGQEAQYVNGYDNGGTQATSRFVQDDNVLKISSLSAYYELPQRWVKPLKLQRVRLNVYMNDVATFSSIKVERGTGYPFARTLSFSLTATF